MQRAHQSRALRTVLFLEDRFQNIAKVRALSDAVFQNIVTVSSAHHALIALQCMPVDLILSAVHLEEESAFDFLRTVKTDERLASVPFIFLCLKPSRFTKAINDSLNISAKALGADHYIVMEELDEQAIMSELQCGLQKWSERLASEQHVIKDVKAAPSVLHFPVRESQAEL